VREIFILHFFTKALEIINDDLEPIEHLRNRLINLYLEVEYLVLEHIELDTFYG
jgi:hypothetical protein